MLVFFTNLSIIEFHVRYLTLFLLFSLIDHFEWFWMGSLLRNIQVMLELASEFESDLQDTVDWGRKWLVCFNAGKTQLVLCNRSNNAGAIDVNMDGSVHEEKLYFKMRGLTFSFKFDWGLKLPPRKLELLLGIVG